MTKEEIVINLNLLRYVVQKKVNLNAFDRGLCPFHQEKTSSFNIYFGKDRARYHCFGCGADGDVFEYLLRTESLSFTLALKKLQLILITNKIDHVIFPLPTRNPGQQRLEINSQINCFLSCENYLNLKEDYEILLNENHKLRQRLNLNDFQSSNETKKIALEPSKLQGEKIICRKYSCTQTPKCNYDCCEFTLDF